MLALFLLFSSILSASKRADNSKSKDTSFLTEWECETRDPHLYIGDSSGMLHFVNLFTGKIDFTLNTGGDLFNSTTYGRSTFLPSIDGFLISYSQTKIDRTPKPIREFEDKQMSVGGLTFLSSKKEITYLVDEKNEIVRTKLNIKTSDDEKSDKNPIVPFGFTRVTRTDYSLTLKRETSKIIKYSDFQISNSKQILYPQKVKLITSLAGDVILLINQSVKTKQKILGVPIVVLGTNGLLDFSPHNGEISLSSYIPKTSLKPKTTKNSGIIPSNQIYFIKKERNAFAIPPAPFQKDHHNLDTMKIIPNIKLFKTNFEEMKKVENQQTRFPINSEILETEDVFPFSTQSIKAITTFQGDRPNNNIYLPIITLASFSVIIIYLSIRLHVERRLQSEIIADDSNPSIGYIEQKKCLIISAQQNSVLIDIAHSSNEYSHLLLTPIKVELNDDMAKSYVVAFPFLPSFDFNQKFDAVDFLRRSLSALSDLHKKYIVHGSINESSFYSSPGDNNRVILGGINNCSHYASSTYRQEFQNDVNCIKNIVKKHLNNAYTIDSSKPDPILLDFIDNQSDQYMSHPLFQTSLEKLAFFEEAYRKIQSSSNEELKKLEKHSSQIFGKTWAKNLHKSFLQEASKQRRYNTRLVKDLISLIRNKWEHKMKLNDLNNDGIKKIYGNGSPDCYFNYFHSKYPNLFMVVYNFCH